MIFEIKLAAAASEKMPSADFTHHFKQHSIPFIQPGNLDKSVAMQNVQKESFLDSVQQFIALIIDRLEIRGALIDCPIFIGLEPVRRSIRRS